MAESEPLDRAVKVAEGELKKEWQQVEAEKNEALTRTDADRKELNVFQAERAQAVAQIDRGVYQRYERVRKARAGVAVSEAVEGRCAMCHMTVRPQFLQDLRKGDQIMTCESCGRILYFEPPVTIEELTGEAAPVRFE